MLDDDEHVRSNVIDSVVEASGLIVFQLVRRNDGVYDIYRAMRGRFPEPVETALSREQARAIWEQSLTRTFGCMTADRDELDMLVQGRLDSLFR